MLLVLVTVACDFGPLEPGAPFTPGVYVVDVRVEDGCGQSGVGPDEPLECRGGIWTDPDEGDALIAFWPEVDRGTYVINDGVVPQANSAPVLRWSTGDRTAPEGCPEALQQWVLTLTNDDAGRLNGSLRYSWTGVETCPVGGGAPTAECVTRFVYSYALETACAAPCELVDAGDEPAEGEPYDCGASVCECP
ncbi:MAG: hypothetical protein IAG13_17205 [Deltaproteobacteria bacterium]|nr:hypothetical protein [Nannocystaceae bacterium]